MENFISFKNWHDQQDIFYVQSTNNNLKEKIKILNIAYIKNTSWWVDKLDCNESWMRQKIDMSFKEIMAKFDNTCHFVIIQRNSRNQVPAVGEIGFSTMTGSINYFLWINLNLTDFNQIVKTYKLNLLK